jgi:hypothetical protein
VIQLEVLMYVRYPLSLWFVEDLTFERGIDIFRRNGCLPTGAMTPMSSMMPCSREHQAPRSWPKIPETPDRTTNASRNLDLLALINEL